MRTTSYNPSVLEQQFAKAFAALRSQLQEQLDGVEITNMTTRLDKDNPDVVVEVKDADGDPHELVINFIQRPDQF